MAYPENPEHRLKRLHMRSWRRGMKEMDLILGPFSDGPLAGFSDSELDRYETLLDQNDQNLYRWITARVGGQKEIATPPELELILDQLAEFVAQRSGKM